MMSCVQIKKIINQNICLRKVLNLFILVFKVEIEKSDIDTISIFYFDDPFAKQAIIVMVWISRRLKISS